MNASTWDMYDTYEALREEENEKGTTYSMHGLMFTADTERTCKASPILSTLSPLPLISQNRGGDTGGAQ